MSTSTLRIAVIGAGIAGLTTAAALARRGVRCQVYEQAKVLAEVGAGIQLAPNATRLLARLGLTELPRLAVQPAAIEMRRWNDGRQLGRTVLGAACVQRYGAPYYTVHRADLHGCLLGQLAPDSVTLGHRLVGIADIDGALQLRFGNGRTVTADAVLGADGIHSVVRRWLVSDSPRYSGQVMYRGLVPATAVPLLAQECKVSLWLGPGRHCVSYPVSAGRYISFGATMPADGRPTESWTEPGRLTDLITGYSGWHDDVLTLLRAADTVTRSALHDRDPIATWCSGAVALVGDAAHPMLPFVAQGANQAIEDAIVLADLLGCASPGTVADALRRYEELRRPRTDEVHQRSRTNQQTLHLRDEDRLPDLQEHAWLYEYDAGSAAQQSWSH
jgi:salicylate hydroxylase